MEGAKGLVDMEGACQLCTPNKMAKSLWIHDSRTYAPHPYGYFYQNNGPVLKFTSRITGIIGDICGVIFLKVDHENA